MEPAPSGHSTARGGPQKQKKRAGWSAGNSNPPQPARGLAARPPGHPTYPHQPAAAGFFSPTREIPLQISPSAEWG